MRLFLYSLTSACLIVSSLHADCQSDNTPVYENAVAASELHFIDGLFMNTHNRKESNKNIIDCKRNNLVSSGEEKKFTVVNNQVVLVSANTPALRDTINAIPDAVTTSTTIASLNQVDPAAQPANPETAPATAGPNNQPYKLAIPAVSNTAGEEPASETEEEPVEPMINKYAEMISVEPSEITNYPLYHFIDEWYGTRYRYGGSDRKGIDCSAFTQKLYTKVYSATLVRTAREQHRTADRIKHYEDAAEGDLVFFRIHRLRISHVGVYLANGYFVHASKSKGVTISSLSNKYWSRRYASCGHVEREDRATESDFIQ